MKGFVGRTAIFVVALVALIAVWVASAQAAFPGENGKIAFGAWRLDCPAHELDAINPDGSGRIRLVGTSSTNPGWSPDGTKIAFQTDAEFGGISVMNADGSDVRVVLLGNEFEGSYDPAFSADGRTIAFRMNNAIHTIGIDGSGLRRLPNSAPGGAFDADPSWSPDGGQIAITRFEWISFPHTYRTSIYLLDADGSGATQLANTDRGRNPDWSPDGTKITFSDDTSFNPAPRNIHVINVDGSGLRQLTNVARTASAPAWSPDGTKIAFINEVDGSSPYGPWVSDDLFVMNADGSGAVNLSNTPDYIQCAPFAEREPDWQPLPFKNPAKKCKAFPGEYRNHGQCVKATR